MIDDAKAAHKLAELLRLGALKPVHHSDSDERQGFKELVQRYHDVTKQLTRHKNKVKAKFRAHAIPCPGDSVFNPDPDNRDAWLRKLDGEAVQICVQLLWETLDHLAHQRDELLCHIRRLARQFPQVGRFQQLPGIGLIRAATFFALIDTPHRFRTQGKLWVYCGIGIARARSGQSSGPEHLTYFGNRRLKEAAKGAALCAIKVGSNPFATKYRRQLDEGMAPELARLSVARSIVNTISAMWRRDEEYQPDRPNPWKDDRRRPTTTAAMNENVLATATPDD